MHAGNTKIYKDLSRVWFFFEGGIFYKLDKNMFRDLRSIFIQRMKPVLQSLFYEH